MRLCDTLQAKSLHMKQGIVFRWFAILGVALIMTSCSAKLRPFTQDLYERSGIGEEELRRIQFYLSDDIILRRQLSKGETVVKEGKLKMIDGRRVEEVRIASGTPGVIVLLPQDDRFAVSFEEGRDDNFLMFGPNPKNDDRYTLLAKEWKRTRGKVSYNGQLYDVGAQSAYSTLLVNAKLIGETEYNTRKVGGRRVE